MEDFITNLPAWAETPVVIGGCILVAVGGHALARRFVPKGAPRQETELAVSLMAVIAAIIGIMLAFSAVQVWEDFGTADKAVAAEAASASQLYRDLAIYGAESLPARKTLTAYVKSVSEDEWPTMAKTGEQNLKTSRLLVHVFDDLAKIEPTTNRQTVIYGEAFKKLNEVVEHRRARLLAAKAALPPIFWFVALMGSAVMLAYTFVYPSTPMNLMLIAGLAVSLGLIFVFILDVEHPYSGEVSVQPTEMQSLLPLFERLNAQSDAAT